MKIKLNLNVTINGKVDVDYNSSRTKDKDRSTVSTTKGQINFDNLKIGIDVDEEVDATFKEYIQGITDVIKSVVKDNVSLNKKPQETIPYKEDIISSAANRTGRTVISEILSE